VVANKQGDTLQLAALLLQACTRNAHQRDANYGKTSKRVDTDA
jgi:hypothetical protein